jgi:outer membrane protein OmpA-like peptidoglycan-associated protein
MNGISETKLPETLEWYRQTGNWIAIAASALLGVEANFLKQLGSFGVVVRSLGVLSAVFLVLCVIAAIGFFVTLTKYGNALEAYTRRRAKIVQETDPAAWQRLVDGLNRSGWEKNRAQYRYWRCFRIMLGCLFLGTVLLSLAAIIGLISPPKTEPSPSPPVVIVNCPEGGAGFNGGAGNGTGPSGSSKSFTLPLGFAWVDVRPELNLTIGKELKFELGKQRGEKGEPGPPGKDGRDGKDCNCGEKERLPIRAQIPSDAFFDFDRAKLLPEAVVRLRQVADDVGNSKPSHVIIEAYTDGRGRPEYNRRLSQARAEAVRQWLTTWGGIPSDKISAEGKGVSPDSYTEKNSDGSDNPSERAHHRRVDIRY